MSADIKADSPESVELLLNRAKALCQSAHDRIESAEKSRYGGNGAIIRDMVGEIHALEDAIDRHEHGAPQVDRQPYVSSTKKTYGNQNEFKEKHESFGQLQFNRVSGGAHLYGSHVEQHNHYITMQVHRSEVSHSLSSDHYYTDGMTPIVEVLLSAAQFAEAITSMNMGSGVPCTIHSVEGIRMEDVPEEVVAENVKIRDAFKQDIEEIVANAKKARDDFQKIVEVGSSISKGRAREMLEVLDTIVRELDANAPFVVNQFQESAERVVSQAKAEIEAFTMHALHKAGMKVMKSGTIEKLLAENNDE